MFANKAPLSYKRGNFVQFVYFRTKEKKIIWCRMSDGKRIWVKIILPLCCLTFLCSRNRKKMEQILLKKKMCSLVSGIRSTGEIWTWLPSDEDFIKRECINLQNCKTCETVITTCSAIWAYSWNHSTTRTLVSFSRARGNHLKTGTRKCSVLLVVSNLGVFLKLAFFPILLLFFFSRLSPAHIGFVIRF